MQVKWLRVVLDEGHCIKNAAALQAKAARKLDAWSRWSVTGTPIQNSCAGWDPPVLLSETLLSVPGRKEAHGAF